MALAARQTVEGIGDGFVLKSMVAFQQKVLPVLDCNNLVGGQAMDLAGGGSSRKLAEKKTAGGVGGHSERNAGPAGAPGGATVRTRVWGGVSVDGRSGGRRTAAARAV